MNEVKYRIDFTHLFSGNKKTISLADSKPESIVMLKQVKKRFNILWRRSVIYC
jgi:hypothetical protein